MTSNQIQEIQDLRSLGYDVYTIARKLELTVPEVEEVVYGTSTNDTETLLFWSGQHY